LVETLYILLGGVAASGDTGDLSSHAGGAGGECGAWGHDVSAALAGLWSADSSGCPSSSAS
jgi:hypothetical protein